MARSGLRASPTASGDHIHIPPKEWVHGKSRSPYSSSHRHKHTHQRGPPMTLHNHLFLNTIPLPPHHPILILNSQNNLSQNRRHFPQNLSHANPWLPTEHIPTNLPGPKTICRKIGHIFLKISRMLQPFSPPFGGKRWTKCGAFLLYLRVCRGKKRVSDEKRAAQRARSGTCASSGGDPLATSHPDPFVRLMPFRADQSAMCAINRPLRVSEIKHHRLYPCS